MTEGLYQGDTLIKAGNFQSTSRYLSLEQNLGGMSAATFYFTSNEVEKYQKVNILSGFIAHIIYLRCEIQRMGCSGIGAYYDDEAKTFLGTGNNILYLLAIGSRNTSCITLFQKPKGNYNGNANRIHQSKQPRLATLI